MYKAIKNWFLEKQGFSIGSIKELQKNGFEVARETEKAVLINYRIWDAKLMQMWIPKSCMIDEWETKFSPKAIGSAYHTYLVNLNKDEYRKGNLGEPYTFTSGRNRYDGASFRQQWTTKELMAKLDEFGIKYMTKAEFAKSLS